MMPCLTYVISFSSGNFPINGTKQLGTMMPCMTHDNSFYYAKFHANGTKKLGTMMVCITYVISCYFGSNTSSCILLHHIASSCIALHRLASSCNVLHYLASSCIVLQRLAASSHHVTNIQIRSQKQLMSQHIFWLNPTSVEGSKTFINELRSSATGSQFRSDFVFAPPAAARTRS